MRAEAFAVQLEHLARFAEMDAGYARWQAQQLEGEDPDGYAGLLEQLDAALGKAGIKIPAPFEEPPCKLPPQVKGRRGRPPRRFWNEP